MNGSQRELRTSDQTVRLAQGSHRNDHTNPAPGGFLFDPTAIIDAPADTSAGPVLATVDCVSIWKIHDIDGPTDVNPGFSSSHNKGVWVM